MIAARLIPVSLAILLVLPYTTTAHPLFSLENVPTTYVPGSSFSFDLRLAGATNLNAYTVSLLLESSTGVPGAGNDYSFLDLPDNLSDLPSTSRYVFGTDGFGRGDSRGETGQVARLTLLDSFSDFSAEVDTIPGQNDLIARIWISTSSTMTAPLSISFDPGDTLLLDSLGGDIPGLDTLDYSPAPSGHLIIQSAVIPEPSSLLQLTMAALLLYLRFRGSRQIE